MKTKHLITSAIIIVLCFTISCKKSASEKLHNNIEKKSESLEERSEDLEEAAEFVSDGFENMERAIENFKNALEEVDNAEDRRAIRKRINEIMDALEVKKQ